MEICSEYCDFVCDENLKTLVCQKCGYIVTKEDKKRWLQKAFELMREEERIDKPQNN